MKKENTSLFSRFRFFLMVLAVIGIQTSAWAQLSGNPVLEGADPEIHFFNGKYYIYTTAEAGKRFHAYSSADLTNWKDEGVIFDIGPQCSWAENNGWAPGVAFRNNKYYFYYTAEVKIGVAVGDSPTGPFTDLGYPFIGTDPYTDDIIDAMVFIDDDGQAYIYYGGSGKSKMVVRKLNPDMISLASGPSNITPQDYTEGPFLLKRDGVYYMTYSNGAWYNETYNVRYATSNSPMGPWTYRGVILQSNIEDKGPGHHSIIRIGNCDEYYMAYHRYENGLGGGRVVAIDRMNFNSAGLIENVNMTNYGVAPRISDNSCLTQRVVSGGTYKLTHKGTNQCLDVLYNSDQSGANVQQYTDNGNDAQRWIITLEADGFYKLRHKGTNQVLDVDKNSDQSGTNVQQWQDLGNDAQRWKLEAMTDGYFKLTHKGTNLCLDVVQNSNQPNANVIQYTDNNGDAQRWKLELIEDPIVSGGLYRLMHKTTNQCLDVENNSNQPGANVQQYTDTGGDAQRWYVTKESDGFYKLRHKGTTQVLDVNGNSSQPGTNVQQYTDLGSDAQRWKMELMSDGYFKLTHKGTTQCLDVANNLAEPRTNVLQWDDNNGDAQRWKLDLMPDVNPVNGNGDGLTGSYFNGINFDAPVLSRKDAAVDFDWGNGSPSAAINTDRFSVRWTGQVQPRYSGEYTFYVSNDDGGRLWVNNQLIIDKWKDDGGATVYGKIILNAGQKYDIKVEYYENAYGAKAKLEWSSFFQTKEAVPTSQLYSNLVPTVSITSPANNASLNGLSTITINADAFDNGSLTKVDFYNGSNLIGSDNSSPYSVSWNNAAVGAYTLRAIATDNAGAFTISSSIAVSVKSDPNAGNGDGLSGNYFNGMNFETLKYSGKDAVLNMNWGTGTPNAAVNVDQFSVRWTGQIQPKYSGEYTFYINSDNGRRVWVNGQLLIDQWIDNWDVEYTGKITLTAMQKYDIKVEFFENAGGANIKLEWSSTQQAREVIPTSQLYANPLPSVTASSSTTNVTGPSNISLSATASDGDGISKVDFYNGTTLLGSDNSSPYSYAWNNVGVGSYSITALATDLKGGVTLSSAISINVNSATNTAPSVSLTSPSNNSSFNAPATLSIAANATDADGTISKVEFYNGTQKLGEDLSSPYSYNWTNVGAGTYMITAKATDNGGATATSAAATVTVKTVVTDACSGLAQYIENAGYVAGSKVKNAGSRYECKPYPYSGWCNGAAWAYAPGSGAYWADAWTLLGSCAAKIGDDASSASLSDAFIISPNPVEDELTISSSYNLSGGYFMIVDMKGKTVYQSGASEAIGTENLDTGIYTLILITSDNQKVMRRFVKIK